jgi:hypothetical protein
MATALTLALIFHFILIFIYSKPFYLNKNKLEFMSQTVIYPYFQQNWNLFVPAPDSNYKLNCEYENRGIKKIDVFNEVLIKHQTNRFAGYEPILIGFTNSIHYFEKNTTKQKQLNGPITNDLNFEILKRLAKNYIEYSEKIKIKQIKITLIVNQIITNNQRIYY